MRGWRKPIDADSGSRLSWAQPLALAVQGATIEQPGSVYDTRGLIGRTPRHSGNPAVSSSWAFLKLTN